jgi:thioredoxin-like negative regulator of GroEL
MAKEYGILSVPTFIAFYENERVESIKGAVPKSRLETLFKNYE